MLAPPTEPSIGAKNKPDPTTSTEFVQAPQALKMHMMEEVITVTNEYNTGSKVTTRRVSRTGIDETTPDNSSSGISAVASCPSPTPIYGYI